MQPASVIHIIDDDESSRRSLSRLLQAHGYGVRVYSSASAFLFAESEEAPGCILLEAQLPGLSGLDLQKVLATRPNPLPIIFISDCKDVQAAVLAMKAGAVDFLPKSAPHKTLLNAIHTAL